MTKEEIPCEQKNQSPRLDQEPQDRRQQLEETTTEFRSGFLKSSELQSHWNSNNKAVRNKTCTRSKKIHSCTECGKTFNRKMDLFRHNRIHTGDKPFICAVCGQRFGQKSNATRHMTCHTRRKPFSCCVCKVAFKWKHSLVRHRRTHTAEQTVLERKGKEHRRNKILLAVLETQVSN